MYTKSTPICSHTQICITKPKSLLGFKPLKGGVSDTRSSFSTDNPIRICGGKGTLGLAYSTRLFVLYPSTATPEVRHVRVYYATGPNSTIPHHRSSTAVRNPEYLSHLRVSVGINSAQRQHILCTLNNSHLSARMLHIRNYLMNFNNIKGEIHNITAKAALKFGSEAWVLKKREEQRLAAAQTKFLRHLLGITKLDKEKKNQCIREKTDAENIAKEIKQYQEKWLQHVQRMDTNRIPKQASQYKPKGRRHIGRPRKSWRDQFHLEDTRNRNQT